MQEMKQRIRGILLELTELNEADGDVGEACTALAALHSEGLTAVFSINRLPQPLEESGPYAADNLEHTMDNVLRLLEVGK